MTSGTGAARRGRRIHFLPLLILILIGAGWGLGVSLVKFATAAGIPPIGYLFWMTSGAGLVAFLLCLLRGTLPRLGREHLRYYFLTAFTRTASANLIFYSAVQHLPAGVMSVVLGTAPLFTYALALSLRIEGFMARRLAGILLGLGGVVLFVAPRGSLPDPSMAWWVLIGLGAPILYSTANIVIDRMRPAEGNSLTFAVGMMWATSLLMLPVALLTGEFHALLPPFDWAEAALCLHMLISGVAFFGLFELIRMAGPTYASQLTYIITLTGVLSGMAIFGEVHSAWVWLAMALVLGGVALVNSKPARAASES